MTRHDDATRLRHMLDVLWDTIQDDLPALIVKLQDALGGPD